LDEYILHSPPEKLASAKGEALRKQITGALRNRVVSMTGVGTNAPEGELR